MTIELYTNSANPRVVDKTSYLSLVQSVNGTLREESSVVNPIILIETATNTQAIVTENGEPVDANGDPISYDYQLANELPAYNYAYIPNFHRYYFITEIVSVRYGLWRLVLKCDSLMSFKTDILSGEYFCDRASDLSLSYPVLDDPMVSWSDDEEVTLTILDLHGQTYKNISFDTSSDDITEKRMTVYSFVEATKRNEVFAWKDGNDNYSYGETPWEAGNISAPVIAGTLPQITANAVQVNSLAIPYVVTIEQANEIQRGLNYDDSLITHIISVIAWPFEIPASIVTANAYKFFAGDTEFSIPPQGTIYAKTLRTGTTMPYLVLAEFDCPDISSFKDLPTHTAFDIYLPFYGWTNMDAVAYGGDHFIIYYALSIVDGAGSVNLYDTTKDTLVFTAPVQVGRKVLLSTTNLRENQVQSQNIALNAVLGTIGAVFGVGVGLATGNPLLAIGSAGAGVATIAKSVISSQAIIERGSISFGSEATNFFSPLRPYLRRKSKKCSMSDSDYADYTSKYGKPYKKMISISGLSGYFIATNARVSSALATQYEIREMESLLDSGVIL